MAIPAAWCGEISTAAYRLLAQRLDAPAKAFFVFRNGDDSLNHGTPSAIYSWDSGGGLKLDSLNVSDPTQADGCAIDRKRLDQTRGTIFKVRLTRDVPSALNYVGMAFVEPDVNLAVSPRRGYDLRGATTLVFDYRLVATGSAKVRFGVGNRDSAVFKLTSRPEFNTLRLPLNSFNDVDPNFPPSAQPLENTKALFAVTFLEASAGTVLLLDNIRFEPVPGAQAAVRSLPLSYTTFGTVPARSPGDDLPIAPFQSDAVLINLATTYESSLVLLALLERGRASDLRRARRLANALYYALNHDNRGDALPAGPDKANGLHNGLSGGEIALRNGQGPSSDPNKALRGQVRLAGFSVSGSVSPSKYALILDGATGGSNAFAILGLAAAFERFNDVRYLDGARRIGRWIVNYLKDTDATGYGGYFNGYLDNGLAPKSDYPNLGKSVENCADIFSAFTKLAALEMKLGDIDAAATWTTEANHAGDFVMRMFDPAAGRFYAGTGRVGDPSAEGIRLDGPIMGNDQINTFEYLDANTFTVLALAAVARYQDQIDWHRPVDYVAANFAKTVTVGTQTYKGFNLIQQPIPGELDGITWEFTAQLATTMALLDQLYREKKYALAIAQILEQIRAAQLSAPFANGSGLVAATLPAGDTLPPLAQRLHTPFQDIPTRVGLAATLWAIFADERVNVLGP